MNWRSGLIRFSIVLTVLWAVASFLIAGHQGGVLFEGYSMNTLVWSVVHEEAMQAHLKVAAIYWAGGAALWWAFLYTGFWIAKGFRR